MLGRNIKSLLQIQSFFSMCTAIVYNLVLDVVFGCSRTHATVCHLTYHISNTPQFMCHTVYSGALVTHFF